eukprot:364265-Chlamydomonas_euryale.AAC.16
MLFAVLGGSCFASFFAWMVPACGTCASHEILPRRATQPRGASSSTRNNTAPSRGSKPLGCCPPTEAQCGAAVLTAGRGR